MAEQRNVTVQLSADEALELYNLLHRWEDAESVSAPEHRAEQVALWNLSTLLERALVEPFDPHYVELVADSRHRLTA